MSSVALSTNDFAGERAGGGLSGNQLFLACLAICLMPFSFGVKIILGLDEGTPWFNPTLALAPVLLLAGLRPRFDRLTTICGGAIMLACLLGFLATWPQFGAAGLPRLARESGRIALVLVWFGIVTELLRTHQPLLLSLLSYNVLVHFAIGVIFYISALGFLPLPGFLGEFIEWFREWQGFEVFGVRIPRMAGMFAESPPFGLFMLCCHVSLYCCGARLWGPTTAPPVVRGALAVSLVSIIASTAAGDIAGLMLFYAVALFPTRVTARQAFLALPFAAAFLGGVLFFGSKVGERFEDTDLTGEDVVVGHSVSERAYHVRKTTEYWTATTWSTLFGIGPGNYGLYLHQDPVTDFPDSTTPQVTPLTWLCELGTLGTTAMLAWLVGIALKAKSRFGPAGAAAVAGTLIANGFQTTWIWEFWYFALAVLAYGEAIYTVTDFSPTPSRDLLA